MSYSTPDAISQRSREVRIPARAVVLEGELHRPPEASSIVLFAHGSGSGRHSPRNQSVARTLWEKGLGTLLFDLLTREEEAIDQVTGDLRFDIELLCERLMDATRWVLSATDLREPAEESGTLAEVARLAGEWFERYLPTPSAHTGLPS